VLDFRFYIGSAERLAELADENTGAAGAESRKQEIVASILFAAAALESFVNGMLEDYAAIPGRRYETHERAFMLEQDIVFHDGGACAGTLEMTGTHYRPLEHKVLFLLRRIGNHQVDKGSRLWQRFRQAKKTRDSLVHPRRSRDTAPEPSDAMEAVAVTKEMIVLLGQHVWHKSIRF
jgi:hypothetical protein